MRVAGVRAGVPRAEGGGGARDGGALPGGRRRRAVPLVALRRHAQEEVLPHDAHPGQALPPTGERKAVSEATLQGQTPIDIVTINIVN